MCADDPRLRSELGHHFRHPFHIGNTRDYTVALPSSFELPIQRRQDLGVSVDALISLASSGAPGLGFRV